MYSEKNITKMNFYIILTLLLSLITVSYGKLMIFYFTNKQYKCKYYLINGNEKKSEIINIVNVEQKCIHRFNTVKFL